MLPQVRVNSGLIEVNSFLIQRINRADNSVEDAPAGYHVRV